MYIILRVRSLKSLNIYSYKNNFFIFIYFIALIYFVFRTSSTLPPFRDEIVSLVANTGFFLNGFSFEGPRQTIFEGLYNPFLTSPPLSAVGSSIAWSFLDDFNLIRLANFFWVLVAQILFSRYISIIYELDRKKVIIFSGFALVSFPFWFGSIYSLGETISIIFFFNSILLYKTYPKVSIFFMGILVFFGKGILIVLFGFFYFFNLILYKDLKKVPLELSIFIFPSTIWILLIIFKSEYQNISDYIEHFIVMYKSMGSQIGSLGVIEILSLENILNNFENSGVLNWNPSVLLRVFAPPIILFLVLLLKKGQDMMLDVKQLTYFALSLAPLYGWFVLVSPEKPIIYASHFSFPMLMFSLYLLSRKDLKIDLINNSAFFICSLYMTSDVLFLISLLTLLLINIFKRIGYSTLVILICLSIVNSTYEVSKEKTYVVDLTECKKDLKSYSCFNYLINIQNN